MTASFPLGASPSDLDILRSAKVLLDGHGPLGAWLYAVHRAQELAAQGDMGGVATWGRVLDALEELTRTELDPGQATH